MKKMNPKIPDIFIPEDIVASNLLLVGYKLFPAANIALHPRMTVLSGNNAVGKTTILDAVQTILICHQQYINLNVATGQFDRSLSGQLSGRVGWAVLCVSGHEEITALGVRLHAKATADKLELNPFVLTHIPAHTDLFIDREESVIAADFQALKRNILQEDIQGQAHDFASVDEYHRHIFAQGLLPVSMDRQGKKKFATLWSQVTRPKLDRLGTFLKQMLCPDPAQGVKFADVERLMSDRRRLNEQLEALKRFRQTRQELEERRNYLDNRRYLYLGTELGRQGARIRSCQEQKQKHSQKEASTVQEMQVLDKQLAEITDQKRELSKERDKYLSRQSELSRQQRHYEEYNKALQEEKTLQKALEKAGQQISELKNQEENLSADVNEKKNKSADLRAQIAELKERIKYLKEEKEKYEQLQALLAQSEAKTGKRLKTWSEVQEAWIKVQKEKSRLDNLPELKKRLKELDKRVQSHKQARELVKWFAQNYPQIGDLAKLGRQAFENIVNEWEELDFEAAIARVKASLDKLERHIAELEKGRPSLPQAIGRQVDAGSLSLLAARFEHLDLEQAQKVQAKLGPFARAIEVNEPGEISDLDLGDEEFLLVKKNLDLGELTSVKSGQGDISGQGDFYWYAPRSYVWLGAQARARELKRLGREKDELRIKLQGLENEKLQNKERLKKARSLTGMWPALEDEACIKEYTEVQSEISWLEREALAIQERYRYLDNLQRKKEHFDLHEAPAKFKRVQKELQKQEKELKGLEKSLAQLEKNLNKAQKEIGSLQQEFSRNDNQLAGVSSRIKALLEEEPREVLEGRIDFSQAKQVRDKITALDKELADLEKTRDNLNRENVRKGDLLKQIQSELEKLNKDEQQAEERKENFLKKWKYYYPQQEPEFRTGNYSSEDASKLNIEWDLAEKELKKVISSTMSDYALHLPLDAAPEIQVDMILENIIPSFLELDKVEDQFQRLRQELGEIEARIKTYVQDIQKKVDQEIIKLKRRLVKVNEILADIRFGRISQVKIELIYLKHYENLKKLQGDKLTLMDFGNQTTLNEFVQSLIKNIFKNGRSGDINEEQIADYRTYIDLSWSITDLDGQSRQKGFSGGETLGINLAICLGLLFHWGGEAGQAQARGLLIMALDEAERLDEQAVHTVRELLDRAGSQLLVALPRTVQIPDTICHMLTPLKQGVTHVSVYHKG